ncbi:hypothetical protein EsH8_IV_001179 [Colletotrichum jinshuiense]
MPIITSDTACSYCKAIAEAILTWSRDPITVQKQLDLKPPLVRFQRTEIAKFECIARRTECATCQFIAQWLLRTSPHILPCEPGFDVGFEVAPSRVNASSARFTIGPSHRTDGNLHTYLDLVPSPSLTDLGEAFVEVKPHVDINRLKRWTTHCDAHHVGACHSFPAESSWQKSKPPSNLLLVDVVQNCLVQTTAPSPYVALSYVWGRLPDVLETTIANFQQLQTPDALVSDPWAETLPDTVRDAMRLVAVMGHTYLWVDRLCIVQDDYGQKAAQLGQMASIYENAYFTIVAADGDDANYGLRGVASPSGVSTPRPVPQTILRLSPACDMHVFETYRAEIDANLKEWHTRGWTYQERLMSRRNLVFFGDRAMWECSRALFREELAGEPEGVLPDRTSLPRSSLYDFFALAPWPRLEDYFAHVTAYNERRLSFESDALVAFSSALDALGRSFHAGFLFGLPELFFDLALLWHPATKMRRRTDAAGRPLFPSWSWVAWQGVVLPTLVEGAHKLELVDDEEDEGFDFPPIRVSPVTTWYKTCKNTGQRSAVDNSYHEYQRMRDDTAAPLPAGWTRTPGAPGDARPLFAHTSFPDTRFVQPIALADAGNPWRYTDAEQWDGKLSFRAARVFMTLGDSWRDHREAADPKYTLRLHLHDRAGRWAGVMLSNLVAGDEVPRGELCELVVVSEGAATLAEGDFVKLIVEEWELAPQLRDLDTYEFYNALWIVRDGGGVARREGLARIWKTAMLLQDVEEVDVVLE